MERHEYDEQQRDDQTTKWHLGKPAAPGLNKGRLSIATPSDTASPVAAVKATGTLGRNAAPYCRKESGGGPTTLHVAASGIATCSFARSCHALTPNPSLRRAHRPILIAVTGIAQTLDLKPDSAATPTALQSAGRPVALHVHADWCPTCRAQSKAFEAMKSAPGVDLTLPVADYDRERALKRELGVRTQSTLILYRDASETARWPATPIRPNSKRP